MPGLIPGGQGTSSGEVGDVQSDKQAGVKLTMLKISALAILEFIVFYILINRDAPISINITNRGKQMFNVRAIFFHPVFLMVHTGDVPPNRHLGMGKD
jgi:hypothetical protein